MRRRRWVVPVALAAAFLAYGLPAQAQLPPPGGETIKQGLEAAWARQPEQRAAALRRDAAAAGERAARRWSPEPPALDLIAKSDRTTNNSGAREYEATVAVPLWLPRERSRSLAAASAESDVVEARLLATRWRLAAEVREAHWALQRARLDGSLAQQRLENAQQLAVDVARRVEAGDLARSDGHQAEGAVAAAESAAAEATVALSQAAQRWTSLTGKAAPAGDGVVSEAAPPAAAPNAAHPVLRELAARADVARRQAELAGAQTRANPELRLGVSRERAEFGERYAQALVVGVRIPLGAHSRSESKIASASAEQLEAETQLSLEQARIEAEAGAARERVAALATAVAAAERRSRLAGESRGFFVKSFRLGETDLPTRLRIEQETVDAERQATRSRIELAAAISQWRQSLGLLPE
jgi:cobalt-zinc-cadmium efflux system outer membrane protein